MKRSMILLSCRIIEIYIEDGKAIGKVSVDGVIIHLPLMLIMNANGSDRVLIESCDAIEKEEQSQENINVSGNSR